MAKSRKDNRGRVLKPGEVQRKSDNRYLYTYTDPLGRRKYIYASDLMELREKEKKLTRDQRDGLNLYAAGKATINDTFDRYIKTKLNIRDSTRSNYTYMYNRFVRNDFGKKNSLISNIRISCSIIFISSMTSSLPSPRWTTFTRFCIQRFGWQ
mgnify:CR=1 FL=1